MIETNLRIVRPGRTLYVMVRRVLASGANITVDLLERGCGVLRYQHGLAAVRAPGSRSEILVADARPIPSVQMKDEDWALLLTDPGEPPRRMSLHDSDPHDLLPRLIERAVLASVASQTDYWTLGSPRIWYEAAPFSVDGSIRAFRRYEVAALAVDDVGVGVAVDVSTAFFSVHPVSQFFDASLSEEERARRLRHFERLTARQKGQKGTLVYDHGQGRVVCYLEQVPPGVSCAKTGVIRAKGRTYDSLAAYYRDHHAELGCTDDWPAARVTFRGLMRPQWVAANRLWARVMNDSVPRALKNVDKISPADRRALIERFWGRLGDGPLGHVAPGFLPGFWRPEERRVRRFVLPTLRFKDGARLAPPESMAAESYRQHFRERAAYLENAGCYGLPAATGRTLYYAYPRRIGQACGERFASDIVKLISRWSGVDFVARGVQYSTVRDGIEQIRRADRSGAVLFVLDEDPASYHNVAFQLTSSWRVKRVTEAVLTDHYDGLVDGAFDRKLRRRTAKAGERVWQSFIEMNALDVLQQLDAVPWRIDQAGQYEAQFVIDVGHDRRYVALSLLIARSEERKPTFKILSDVQSKTDVKLETINPELLRDHIVTLFEAALLHGGDPITTLLVLRDGRLVGDEPDGIRMAIDVLREHGLLTPSGRVDVVAVNKDTQKCLRFWDISDAGDVANPLEGTAIEVCADFLAVASTGRSTLTQGTAEPILLTGGLEHADFVEAGRAIFDAAQLNWSRPAAAQRLPLPLKRTDEELKARAAQEIRRLR